MRRSPLPFRASETAAWVLVLAAVGAVAWMLLATTFMVYDDEGYVLSSLRDVAAGHPLYTEVYSQYGPLPYVLYRILGVLGYPFTSDSARMFTWACWLGSALFCGLITRRLTGSARLGLAGLVLTAMALTQNRAEPGHPGGLLALATAFAAWLGARQIAGGRWSAFGAWQAGLGAAMLLTKINVGAFHLVASLAWWPFREPSVVRPPLRQLALVVFSAALACALMGGLLKTTAVQLQLVVFFCMMTPLILSQPGDQAEAGPRGPVLAGALAAAAVLGIVLAATLAGGTTWADLVWHGLLSPLRHPSVYHHLVNWLQATPPLALVSLGSVVAWRLGGAVVRRNILMGLKLVALGSLLVGASGAELGLLEKCLFQIIAPLGWALAAPLREVPAGERQARWWLAWLLGWHWLQAYPVAGTQIAWGGFLAIPLVLIALNDLTGPGRARGWSRIFAVCLSLLVLGKIGDYALRFWRDSEPLDLPGARTLRPSPPLSSTLRTLIRNASGNANVLFTYPGMLSLNQWSEIPPPTLANTTHWFSLLSERQQIAVRDRLEAEPRALVVVQRDHLRYLIENGLGPQGPLKDYLHGAFRPVLRLEGYDIWSRRPELFTPVSVVHALEIDGRLSLVAWTTAQPADIAFVEATGLIDRRRFDRIRVDATTWREIPRPGADTTRPDPQPRRFVWSPPDNAEWLRWKNVELRLLDDGGRVLDRLRFNQSPLVAPAFTDGLPPPAN